MGKKKDRRMCKWKKGDIESDFPAFRSMVRKPAYVCLRCGRVADRKKRLCKPVSLGQ